MKTYNDIIPTKSKLERIFVKFFEGDDSDIIEIYFKFEDSGLIFSIDNDTDQIEYENKICTNMEGFIDAFSLYPFIGRFYGVPVNLSWILVNDMGYTDGIQVESLSTDGMPVIFQALASASSYDLFELKLLPLLLPS